MGAVRRLAKKTVVGARKLVRRLRRLEREAVAEYYLAGEGLEIGALHDPLMVPRGVRVRYVDRMTVPELRKHYPELASEKLTPADIVDDGERLSTVGAATQDFVIANHFLEHCENPIETVRNLLRVLKEGGILYLCVPDKRYTFDRDRPVTPFEHLERDFREGPEWSRRDHYEEWVSLMEKVPAGERAARRVNQLLEMRYSIHFHVWTQSEFLELIVKLRDQYTPGLELELFLKLEGEMLVILRRVV